MSAHLVSMKQHEAPYISAARCYMPHSTVISSPSVCMSIAAPSTVQPASRSTVSVTGSTVALRLTLTRYLVAALKISSPAVSSNITLGCPVGRIHRNFYHFPVESPLYPVPSFPPRHQFHRFPGRVTSCITYSPLSILLTPVPTCRASR